MNNLASILVQLTKLDEAEDMHRAALGEREKALGIAHPDN